MTSFAISTVSNKVLSFFGVELPQESIDSAGAPKGNPPKTFEPQFNPCQYVPTPLLRVVEYLYLYPGADTKTVGWACQVGNVSDVAGSYKSQCIQKHLGVRIRCKTITVENHFGEKTRIGHWYLDIVDPYLFMQFKSDVS